ncbi:STY4199 family HEPN domain-containing protein [Buttiauxella sp. WJP83]|uniref:STY4199 family HEPN domain-containing protein n=1 Tax=Buttiauxella sp. WJP83 TaxID=2986951 RepID=UPI0022DDB520|nr:STY4199 family HEPN domain-containing protein [Buttiauxella sp. WJP83]WBM70755.1 STY4199 family HEPN domain-containing protein [Buttiauxella sp. WJP83]
MTSASQLLMREKFETCLSVCRQASLQILPLLTITASEGKDPQWFFQQLEQARLALGSWMAVAKRLNLNDAEISQFTLLLRHLQQLVPQYESGQEISHNQLISALRFVSYLELVRLKQPLLGYSTELDKNSEAEQQKALRQMRALELMLKAMITKNYPSQSHLVNKLKKQFGADCVRRWLKHGEQGDVLSGMRFGELALMVVDKKEFANHYAEIFHSSSQLNLFIDQRKTLQTFLDDVREIRNHLIQQPPLTSVQLALLDSYYQESSAAIQRAWDEGRTTVNPAAFMAADDAQVQEFIELAHKKYHQAGRDSDEVRDTIDHPDLRHTKKKQDTGETLRMLMWCVAGVALISAAIVGMNILSEITKKPAKANSDSAKVTVVDSQPYSQSAREKLANIGITWEEGNLRSAIERGDSTVVRLFMQSGMNWKVYYTESALAGDYRDALNTLLQYPSQMDEERPCRRMVRTVSQAMNDGQSLTSLRKQFLQTFCSTPETVKRQKEDLERAKLRLQAQQQRNSDSTETDEKRAVEIQKAIYDAMR